METDADGRDGPASAPREEPLPGAREAALAGPRDEALTEAYRRFAPWIARLAMRLLGRADEVDDMVQDVFLAAAEKGWQLRDESALRGWLGAIAVNRARNRLRFRRWKRFLSLDGAEGELPAAVLGPAATAEARQLLGRVFAALDRLPTEDRLAFSLRHLEELELDECARLCGCSLATLKRRLSAAQSVIEREVGP